MEYKLFTEFITLQALLKEVGIIQSGGAIKGFLAETQVLFNGQEEQRRGKKIRIGDTITIPSHDLVITLIEPSQAEQEAHTQALAEKERVARLVKQMNQENKKKASAGPSRKSMSKTKKKSSQPVRFPGT
ncbi:S4 domain-containing protein YaaA [Streptococcus ictaluri]|uniref:S4 domain protein YaaA n=1 Tax=Streptococcus ictaluri 707-05 TaxID=764299 RepID=G5K0M2_9STRE|nr:S4 domain-containing protein YaaA [Streptococcus ictaluri]EHI70561.1 S4 domain protein YaaA [Streptococcus ictaluri 707-05]